MVGIHTDTVHISKLAKTYTRILKTQADKIIFTPKPNPFYNPSHSIKHQSLLHEPPLNATLKPEIKGILQEVEHPYGLPW